MLLLKDVSLYVFLHTHKIEGRHPKEKREGLVLGKEALLEGIKVPAITPNF